MKETKIATRYAKSIFAIALEKNIVIDISNDMEVIRNIGNSNRDIIIFLKNPIIKHSKKVDVLNSIFTDLNETTKNFIQFLLDKNREAFLINIAEEFIKLANEYQNIKVVNLTTSSKISDEFKTTLVNFTKKIIDKDSTIQIKEIINENIIGGFKLFVDNQLYDASLERKVNVLKREFSQNLYKKTK